MATRTKKELIDRIAEQTGAKRVQVKKVVQQFLEAFRQRALKFGNRVVHALSGQTTSGCRARHRFLVGQKRLQQLQDSSRFSA